MITGRKVVLEHFCERDITESYLAWLQDPEVVRYSNQRFINHNRSPCLAYLASFEDSPSAFYRIAVRDSGKVIGTLAAHVAVPHQTADLGILIGCRDLWGQGLGQDAWQAALSHYLGRPDIRKVTAGTMAANIGMVKLMERSGMTLEATRPGQELLDGVPQALVYYGRFARHPESRESILPHG